MNRRLTADEKKELDKRMDRGAQKGMDKVMWELYRNGQISRGAYDDYIRKQVENLGSGSGLRIGGDEAQRALNANPMDDLGAALDAAADITVDFFGALGEAADSLASALEEQ